MVLFLQTASISFWLWLSCQLNVHDRVAPLPFTLCHNLYELWGWFHCLNLKYIFQICVYLAGTSECWCARSQSNGTKSFPLHGSTPCGDCVCIHNTVTSSVYCNCPSSSFISTSHKVLSLSLFVTTNFRLDAYSFKTAAPHNCCVNIFSPAPTEFSYASVLSSRKK